jgi:hypothetical protein
LILLGILVIFFFAFFFFPSLHPCAMSAHSAVPDAWEDEDWESQADVGLPLPFCLPTYLLETFSNSFPEARFPAYPAAREEGLLEGHQGAAQGATGRVQPAAMG